MFLVVRPEAPNSVLAPSLVAMSFVTSSVVVADHQTSRNIGIRHAKDRHTTSGMLRQSNSVSVEVLVTHQVDPMTNSCAVMQSAHCPRVTILYRDLFHYVSITI